MHGKIVAIHSLGFMIRPENGAANGSEDVYFADPESDGFYGKWKKGQNVTYTLKAPAAGVGPKAETVEPEPVEPA